MWPNPSYLFLAALSTAFAIMILLFFSPVVETSSVRDLMWLTFLFLMLDAVLSGILAFVKAGNQEKKSK
ncbi:MAG: hypothetical protein FGF48_00730 [Candidatus Brockarchaeota archaeon]|nr:hypothetical protein [Candidatus Brockarchaeota archaeon]